MRLLDLYCCAGGCSVGYHRAGFTEIVGVDNRPQPHYPFEFFQGDAIEYCRRHAHEFDAIHASPPCQKHSSLNRLKSCRRHNHVDMIPDTRKALLNSGKLYVMENVPGSPLLNAMTLCGTEFNLAVVVNGQKRWLRRHRLFESNAMLMAPGTPCTCGRRLIAGVYGHGQKSASQYIRGFPLQASLAREIMGIDWMSRDEVSQAIPPAYTEFIGRQLLAQLKR